MEIKVSPYSPNLLQYWSLTIRFFSVINRTLIGWVLPFCRDSLSVFYDRSRYFSVNETSSSPNLRSYWNLTIKCFWKSRSKVRKWIIDTTGWGMWSTENCSRNLNLLYAQSRICPGKWDAQPLLEVWHRNGSRNLGQMNKPNNNQERKKRTGRIVDFAVLAGHHREKLKESGNTLLGNWKKLWNVKETVIPIVIGAFVTDYKG